MGYGYDYLTTGPVMMEEVFFQSMDSRVLTAGAWSVKAVKCPLRLLSMSTSAFSFSDMLA